MTCSSKMDLSFFIKLKILLFKTKKPPLINLLSPFGFSWNLVTISLSTSTAPNFAGGLTIVSVAIFL